MEIITSFVTLLTGLSIFLVGIHQMSSGLEKVSSKKMSKGMSKVSNNRFVSFGFGAFITAIMQSSGLVTVMTISFLNANLLTLYQGIAIILGANVGTTLTGLLSSFATFDFAIYFSLFTLVGVVIEMTAKKSNVKRIGQIFIGFGLIFIGLNLASDSFKNDAMKTFISNVFEAVNYPVFLIMLSILFTAIVNSSTLVVGLSILLVSSGTIPIEYALFIVLGAEVGTTATGLLASLRGNADSKRLALVQFIFNLLGCVIFTLIIIIFNDPILNFIKSFELGFQVSLFQIFFNISTAVIALLFIKQLEKLSYLLVKPQETKTEDKSLKFVTERLLKTPSFALAALEKELLRMFELVKENLNNGFISIENGKPEDIKRVDEIEDVIDYLNSAISLYLVKLSSERLNYHAELLIGKMYHVINDLERIADHAHNFVHLTNAMVSEQISFSGTAQEELKTFILDLRHMFDLTYIIYTKNKVSELPQLDQLESLIDHHKASYEKNHVVRLRTGECQLEHSKYFFDFTSQLERIGDHLVNIGYSTVDVVGDVKTKKTS